MSAPEKTDIIVDEKFTAPLGVTV